MPAIDAENLHKAFGPQTILRGAYLTVARGEKVGLIGDNGSGKSTLARILAGLETADEGSVRVRRGLTVGYLAQEPDLPPDRSAREVVELGLVAWRKAVDRHAELTALLADHHHDDALLAEQAALDETIAHLGGWDRGHVALDLLQRLDVRDPERAVGPRSGGERRRIALAQLLVARPDVAILDEPTNHLDADTAGWLEGYLADEYPGAVILVTHDRYFLEAIVDRILELDRGALTEYLGGYSDYLELKAERLAHEERTEQNRRNVLRREREWLSRGPKARTTKQKARIQRAHALIAETPADAGRDAEVVLAASVTRQGKRVLELEQVVLRQGGRLLNHPIDLHVHGGDRIGILGPNGCGKTTLLRAILGEPLVASGQLVVGRNTKIGYLDQARANLDDDKSIYDDVKGVGATTVVLGKESYDLRTYLERFLFPADKQRQKVGSLSGGERARVALAKMLREGANMLLFDEPTNDLDLSTLSALEELLVGYDGSVLVVTHDRAFLDRVATSVLAFAPEGDRSRVEQHGGGYSDYVAHRKEREAATAAAATTVVEAQRSKPPPKAEGKKLTYGERLELESILEKIDAAEQKVAACEAAVADPTLYASRGHEVPQRTAELAAAKAEAARLLTRWEELEAKRDA